MGQLPNIKRGWAVVAIAALGVFGALGCSDGGDGSALVVHSDGAASETSVGNDANDGTAGDTDGDSLGGDASDGSSADVGPPDDVSETIDPDTTVPDRGGPGAPCISNDDCDSSLCIDTANGQVCAQTCVDNCADGYACKVPPGVDATSYCLPRFVRLCDPCLASTTCAAPGFSGAACVDRGPEGAFCGVACLTDKDCPTNIACLDAKSVEGSPVRQCGPPPGETCSCSPLASALGLSTICQTQGDGGVCKGVRSCGGATPGLCTAKPVIEVCNGEDDDCDGQTDEAVCDDANSCTTDACAKDGSCSHVPAPGACDADSNACTEGDACKDGLCTAGKEKVCNDNNPCTLDACLPASGCTVSDDDGAGCDDGDLCTFGELCSGGSCGGGLDKLCKASGFCMSASCDTTTGGCKEAAIPAQTPCSDGNVCTSGDGCVDGSCVGKAIPCDDGNPCTVDACDPAKGCTATPSAQACDDGNPCTTADLCDGGVCAGKTVDALTVCDDGNVCTTEGCNPSASDGVKPGCTHTANTALCDDGNSCTQGDACEAKACASGTNTCQCQQDADCAAVFDGNLCNGTLYCDKTAQPYKCKINPKTVVVCDASQDSTCSKVACSAKTGTCAQQPVKAGAACDADNSVCTSNDACDGLGACAAGATLPCDDGNPCTADGCAAATGCFAKAVPDQSACGDKLWCVAGSCVASVWCGDGKLNQTSEQCDDGNSTLGDGCDADCKLEPAQSPGVGDLIITEIMPDPVGTEKDGEWFEVTNVSNKTVKITGLTIADGFGSEVIKTAGLQLAPGAAFVFASAAGLGAAGKADYVYDYTANSIQLSNKSDTVRIALGSTVIDTVTYGTSSWPSIVEGKSLQLSTDAMDATSNNNGLNWCVSAVAYGNGKAFGSPGAKNVACGP